MNKPTAILYPRYYQRTDKGAALMVSIVLIFLLTLMGLSSMRNASLDKTMVTNALQARDVFQAAESSNAIVLNDLQNLTDAYDAEDKYVVIDTIIRNDIGLNSQVTLRFIGEGNAIGASLNAMQGAASFDALRYVAEGVASVEAIQAGRRIDQGASRTVPAN